MSNTDKATRGQIERATNLLYELEGSVDILHVFEHMILETDRFNADDAEILSWFPADVLDEAIQWLEVQARAYTEDTEVPEEEV